VAEQLTQHAVDEVRMRALMQILVSHVTKLKDPNPPVQHLRFPKPHVRAYALYPGNPPPDVVLADARPGEPMSDQWRFPWEKGLRLECDLGYIRPETALHVMRLLADMQASGGKEPVWDIPQVKEHLVAQLHESDARMELPDKPGHILTLPEIHMQEDIERHDIVNLIKRRALKETKRMRH
jgi:hypothetical protein